MRDIIGLLTIFLLAGCAGSPPSPPTVKGEYRPINRPVEVKESTSAAPLKAGVFDFSFEGDIVDSLVALRSVQPKIKVLPPRGKVTPLPVRVTLSSTTLENALRAIGEQGRDVAEVVWNSTKGSGGDQVFIRFRTPSKQQAEENDVFAVKPEKQLSSTKGAK